MIGINTEVLISMPPTLQQPTQPPCAKVSSLRRNCCSVTQLYLTLCNLMDSSMPGFPVLHYLPELAQTHVHWVCDAIQTSHPLLSPLLLPSIFPSISVFSNESLFASGGRSIGVSALASVLPMIIQDWFPLQLTGLITLLSKGLSRVFSNTTIQKHHFFSAQPSLWSNFHICTWLLEKSYPWLNRPLLAKWCLCFLIRYPGLS